MARRYPDRARRWARATTGDTGRSTGIGRAATPKAIVDANLRAALQQAAAGFLEAEASRLRP